MSSEISILDTTKQIDLSNSKEDVAAVIMKSIAGIVPFGGAFGEIISTIIPNQKMERVVDFLKILAYKLENAERRIEQEEVKTAEYADLLEDAINQASRATTPERLDYLATMMKNGVTKEDLDHFAKKRLLSLLGQLNDAEIILLKSYAFRIRHAGVEPYKDFYETHKNLLEPLPPARIGSQLSQDVVNQKAMRFNYETNLEKLGLIEDRFENIKEGVLPKFDSKTGRVKSKSRACTSLGMLLLDHLDSLPPQSS